MHRTVLVVDVESFGDRRRTNQNQRTVREGMYRALRWALGEAGIAWYQCYTEDRGDAVFMLAESDVPKASFVEVLPHKLIAALRRHNSTHSIEERIRLRMALHAGEVIFDSYGVTGEAINVTFRLIDAPPLKKALTGSQGVLAVVVSSWFYREVVRHSADAEPARYREIAVSVKETNEPAWIFLPDDSYPHAHTEQTATPRPASDLLLSTEAPRRLPPPPGAYFTGRAKELTELDSALGPAESTEARMPIAVIAGMGGIGKTWLALRWAHENLGRFPDGQLYVNLRGFDPSGTPVAPPVAIRGFLDALGLPPGSIPMDPDAQAALYRSTVADRRMLVMIDNARDSGQVVTLLPNSPTCTVLVTSRHQLPTLITAYGAIHLSLDTLGISDAHTLLAKRLGSDRAESQREAVRQLVDHCAGLPLALAIVAARAMAHPGFRLAVLAADLGKASERLDVLDGGELDVNLRAVLSWSYQALDEDAAEVFRLLGLAPGPDISAPAAAVLTGLSENRVTKVLRKLENAHLVQLYAPTRYRMHDLVRLYAAERADMQQPPESRKAALRRLIAYYVHATRAGERMLYPDRKPIDIGEPEAGFRPPSFTDDASILDWFDKEHACLLAAQATAVKFGWHDFVWKLAWTMHGYLWRTGHLQEQITTWTAGVAAAQALADPEVEGVAQRLLGQACVRAGKHSRATDHFYRALDLAKQTGDVHGEARSYYDLAGVWRDTDDREALRHATAAFNMFQTLRQPVWEAEALTIMGWHQAGLGEFDEARASCERALELFRSSSNRQGQAVSLDTLGYIALCQDEYSKAVECLRESLELCRDLGATYYEADALDHLGQAYAALGQRVDAKAAWQRALGLNRAQGRTANAQRVEGRLVDLLA